MKLIQDKYAHDPWKILVVGILLNRTRGSFAEPIIDEFFKKYHGPLALLGAREDEVIAMIRPLGFYRKKTEHLRRMSIGWLKFTPVEELHGVGRYGQDSYRIFVDKDLTIKPIDKKLKQYLKEKNERMEDA
jgi:methyl-CpG-binding domain protein 4